MTTRSSRAIDPNGPPRWVFVGPSVPGHVVAGLVPGAEIRPPIRRGDLDKVPSPAVVAIIDGVFDSERAVSPREIRTAIARGLRIVGASSMGALRASEVPQMLGVGRIYEMYRDGLIQRDDEVAILLDMVTGRALTEPLVNVRFSVSRLVSQGSLEAQHGVAIVDAAARLNFHDRVYRNIVREAGLGGTADSEALILALQSNDLKREDAITLLERLDELGQDAHWAETAAFADERADGQDDAFDRVRAKRVVRSDAPLVVWECGESIDFMTLLRFVALTGRLDEYARRAVHRFLLDDGAVPHPKGASKLALPGPQALFDRTTREWGWQTEEEFHVTLRDLGIGIRDLEARFGEEHEARVRMHGVLRRMPPVLRRALRFELFTNDLALKREAMRLGALRVLARGETTEPTPAEHAEAKRAFLCGRPDLSWAALLAECAAPEAEIEKVIRLAALARRRGVPLLESLERGRDLVGIEGAGVATLAPAPRAGASIRAMGDAEAASVAKRLAKTIGVTRVAQIGELDRFGLHVAAAYRPSSWSSSLGSGKSEHVEGAFVGAVMEEVEKYCQDLFEVDVSSSGKPFEDWLEEDVVDPDTLALPYDSSYSPARALDWSPMTDLVRGSTVHVPAAALTRQRLPNDIFFSERLGAKCFSTNGLASSFTLADALSHALSELIERHAEKLAELALSNPGSLPESTWAPFSFVDLSTCPESIQRIVRSIRAAGYDVRVMDITCEVTVPSFAVNVVRPGSDVHGVEDRFAGYCAHPNAEVAICRALLEAVQTRLINLSGAREDLALKARSLGRHERPRPLSRGDSYWIRPWVPKQSFAANVGFRSADAREDVAFIVRRLTAASFDRVLYRDLSREESRPAHVVRVVIPGMEDVNPFHTGIRARIRLVQDLMRRHEW